MSLKIRSKKFDATICSITISDEYRIPGELKMTHFISEPELINKITNFQKNHTHSKDVTIKKILLIGSQNSGGYEIAANYPTGNPYSTSDNFMFNLAEHLTSEYHQKHVSLMKSEVMLDVLEEI